MGLSISSMVEATRLTRAGRLSEALALLQRPPQKPKSPEAPREHDRKKVRMALLGRPDIDILPRGSDSGSWTAPRFDAPHGTGTAVDASLTQPHVPKTMHGLLGHLRRFGGSSGLRGMPTHRAEDVRATSPDGARFEERSYANDGGSRRYKIYVPAHYCGEPLPLIVMLHGCKQSPDDFARGTQMNELAQEQGFVVAYPEQPPSANSSKCWNWFNTGDQLRDEGEPSLIAGITRQIPRDLAIDPTRIYIAGLSAGGATAAIMGSTYPDLYAAIGVHSGLACGAAKDLPSAFAAMRRGGFSLMEGAKRPLPTIVFHGDRDHTVSPVNGDQVIAQSKAAAELHLTISRGQSAGGINYTRTVQADASGCPVLEQWVLHGAGHAWSGGSSAGSYTDPRGPNASREMLRFFLEHPSRAD